MYYYAILVRFAYVKRNALYHHLCERRKTLTVHQRVARIAHVHARRVLDPVDFRCRIAGGLALDDRIVADLDDTRRRTERNHRKADGRLFRCTKRVRTLKCGV